VTLVYSKPEPDRLTPPRTASRQNAAFQVLPNGNMAAMRWRAWLASIVLGGELHFVFVNILFVPSTCFTLYSLQPRLAQGGKVMF
jgi:hypothetical protein